MEEFQGPIKELFPYYLNHEGAPDALGKEESKINKTTHEWWSDQLGELVREDITVVKDDSNQT